MTKIGILFEGEYDRKPLEALVSRILSDDSIEYEEYPAYGSILGKLDAAATKFFSGELVCKLGIYLSDIDKNPSKRRRIQGWITRYQQTNSNTIIGGYPDPCFEQWLLTEENAIKLALDLPGDQPLPYGGISHPKSRLKSIIYNYDKDFVRSTPEVYVEIVQHLDLRLLAQRDAAFRRFREALVAAY